MRDDNLCNILKLVGANTPMKQAFSATYAIYYQNRYRRSQRKLIFKRGLWFFTKTI